jgi:AraC-like DNA-binding protein
MAYLIAKPSPALAPYVRHYWALDHCHQAGQCHTQRIVPSGLPELIFYFSGPPACTLENRRMPASAVLSGQTESWYELVIRGRLSLFSILFEPAGLSRFIDLPIRELLNCSIPLRFVLAQQADDLEDRLYAAGDFGKRVAVAEHFLMERIKKRDAPYAWNRIGSGLAQIRQEGGLVSVNSLADRACYSRKQFERKFSDFTGASPKQFLRIIRFQHSIHTKARHPEMSLTALSYACGYYDQAHMVNEFKQLSGMTPGNFFASGELLSDYFA